MDNEHDCLPVIDDPVDVYRSDPPHSVRGMLGWLRSLRVIWPAFGEPTTPWVSDAERDAVVVNALRRTVIEEWRESLEAGAAAGDSQAIETLRQYERLLAYELSLEVRSLPRELRAVLLELPIFQQACAKAIYIDTSDRSMVRPELLDLWERGRRIVVEGATVDR